MTILNELLTTKDLLNLNATQLDTIYGRIEKEVMQSPEFLEHLRATLEKEVVPEIRRQG